MKKRKKNIKIIDQNSFENLKIISKSIELETIEY